MAYILCTLLQQNDWAQVLAAQDSAACTQGRKGSQVNNRKWETVLAEEREQDKFWMSIAFYMFKYIGITYNLDFIFLPNVLQPNNFGACGAGERREIGIKLQWR